VPGVELVRNGSSYTVHAGSASIAFPSRPAIRTYPIPPLTAVVAASVLDDIEELGFTVFDVPPEQAYDPGKGLDGSRDGSVKAFENAKVKETKTQVAGLDGRRVDVTGTYLGVPARCEIHLVWDAKHRRMISVLAITSSNELPAAARAFLNSLAISAK
jgi:hypothetical protein